MLEKQNNQLSSALEAVLFSEGVPMKKTLLAQLLGVDAETLEQGVQALKTQLQGRGVELVIIDTTIALRTGAQFSELLQKISIDANSGELSKAALEVLFLYCL